MITEVRPHRIHLLGEGRYEEGVAAGIHLPGHLLELNAVGKYQKHSTAGGAAEPLFALEDALQGNTIEDATVAEDTVPIIVAAEGNVVFAFLSAGEDVAEGAKLTSNGDGTLKAASGGNAVLGIALEAIDASDSNNADTRIRVRIL